MFTKDNCGMFIEVNIFLRFLTKIIKYGNYKIFNIFLLDGGLGSTQSARLLLDQSKFKSGRTAN